MIKTVFQLKSKRNDAKGCFSGETIIGFYVTLSNSLEKWDNYSSLKTATKCDNKDIQYILSYMYQCLINKKII